MTVPSPGSSQESVTESWVNAEISPVGLAGSPGAGSGAAGVWARTQVDLSLAPAALMALMRYT